MELKIKISEGTYEEIKKDDKILLSKVQELFDAVRNGTPTKVFKNKIEEFLVLDKKEANIFNSLSNEQKEVVGKLLDNAVREAEEKSDDLVSEKDIDDHKEVCKLMTDYLGRRLDKHEIQAISIYKAIEHSKDTLTGLIGMDRILVKMFIRSLVS